MDILKPKKKSVRIKQGNYLKKEVTFREIYLEENEINQKPSKEYFRLKNEDCIESELGTTDSLKSKGLERNKIGKRIAKIFLALSLFIIAAFIIYAAFVFFRVHSVSNNISGNTSSIARSVKSTALALIPSQRKELLGEKEGRINILLLGSAGDNNPGRNLTDTIMIASIDIESKRVALLSLPRDMYVKIPKTNSLTKINGLYQYGLKNKIGAESIRESVEEVTGLSIHYHLVVDYDGFTKFIDALGGINVDVQRDIYDTRYPGPNYSYQTFELKKGYQKLDGETALKYVRERHDDPQGDFGRAKRQQQVMQSAKNKAFSIKTILNPIRMNELLSELEKNIRTDLALDDIESLLMLSKKLDTQNISTKVVDAWKKDSLLKVSHVFYGDVRAFILVPRAGNFSQIHELAENIFNMEKIEKRKTAIADEDAEILILNASTDRTLPRKVQSLLTESMGIRNIEISNQSPSLTSDQTEIFDMTEKSKIFTLDELVKSVPARLAEKNESEDFKKYDFVLILGKDIVNSYKFDEDDIEQFRNSQDTQEYFEIKE